MARTCSNGIDGPSSSTPRIASASVWPAMLGDDAMQLAQLHEGDAEVGHRHCEAATEPGLPAVAVAHERVGGQDGKQAVRGDRADLHQAAHRRDPVDLRHFREVDRHDVEATGVVVGGGRRHRAREAVSRRP